VHIFGAVDGFQFQRSWGSSDSPSICARMMTSAPRLQVKSTRFQSESSREGQLQETARVEKHDVRFGDELQVSTVNECVTSRLYNE
jgi:hypothetical protein